MDDHQRSFAATACRTMAGVLLVAGLVFGLGWAGARLAEARHKQPVTVGKDGTVKLEIRQSDWAGDVVFVEIPKYSGYWRCSGEWEVSWLFVPPRPGLYEVRAEVAAATYGVVPLYVVVVGDHVLRGDFAGPSSPGAWPLVRLGQVKLESTPYRLQVKPAAPGQGGALNLKSVTIAPVAPVTQPVKGENT